MERKIIWRRCLIIGISSTLLLLINGCNEDIDYTIKAKWLYINETECVIGFLPKETWTKFNVSAHDTTFYIQNSDGPKNVTVESFVPPINPQAVIIDGIKCNTSLADSLRIILSYGHKKIGERNYEFIFRFTDKNLSDALDCE